MIEDPTLPETVEIRAFGQSLSLRAPRSAFLRADSLWRLKTHYGPALAARSLPLGGTALDIGAGFGAFALPFALANPDWIVFAFEPDPACFAALAANAATLGATNLCAVPVAVGGDEAPPTDPDAVLQALGDLMAEGPQGGAADRLQSLLPRLPFARHLTDHGFLQPGAAPDDRFQTVDLPTLPASLLAAIAPQLLKLTAPQSESAILAGLHTAPLDHILGERWSHVDFWLASGPDKPGLRSAWLPQAGTDLVVLRHTPQTLRPGLDIVVAMYNSQDFIVDCLAGLTEADHPGLRVLVVDDGSTDSSAELVRYAFGHNPRLRLLQKPNGGCASARNFGRLNSDASHIAFVDADDLPDAGLFPGLFELAAQTGAEVVQAGFHLVEEDASGALVRRPSDDRPDPHARRHALAGGTFHLAPSDALMTGQPTIWRRVYRRDFLDNRRIWFPEHIRAFDDQIFQLLTLQAVPNVPVLDGVSYGYRQHPGQDIKQKDERHFYTLEMFRLTLRRAISDGWHDFAPLLRAFVNTVNWVSQGLRPDLLPAYLQGVAELWVLAGKVLGPRVTENFPASDFLARDLAPRIAAVEALLADLPQATAYVFLDSPNAHVPMVRAPWG